MTVDMAESDLAQQVIKRYEKLKAERINWDAHWDEVAKYVIPRKDNVYGQATPGEKRGNRLFDTEAIRANDDLASALHSMLTNPQIPWFGLTTGDPELDKNEDVKKYLFESVRVMLMALSASNFNTEILETYTDLGSIGTNTLRIEEDEVDDIRFYSEPVYFVQIDENHKGDVDVVSRMYEYTKRQILSEFKLTDAQIKELGDDPFKKWEIVHEVRPRDEVEKSKGVGQGAMPWASIHVLKDRGIVLRNSGFEEFPYAVPRWTKVNKERYGRSPAMKVLADIKMINSMKKVVIQGAQLVIAPPLQVPDTGFLAPIKTAPFSSNYYRAGSKDRIEPLFTAGRPEIGLDIIDSVKVAIRQAYFLDKLNVDLGDRATTVEVMQRRDEQLRALGPILGRLDRELLKPVIERTFGVLSRRGKLPEAPDALRKINRLQIRYTSTIARAQLISTSDNIVRAITASGPIIQMQPEVMDNVDGDALLRQNFEVFGVDPSLLRKESDVAQMRQARQEALAQQAEMEKNSNEAEVINKIGAVDGGNQAQGQ